MFETAIDEERIKTLFKTALLEVIEEKKDFLQELLEEVIGKSDMLGVLVMKKYTNIFKQAEKHPKAKQFHESNLARIKLAKAIHHSQFTIHNSL